MNMGLICRFISEQKKEVLSLKEEWYRVLDSNHNSMTQQTNCHIH